MEASEEMIENTRIAIQKRNAEMAADRELLEKQQFSEPVKQWIKDKLERPLSGRDLTKK